MKIQEMKPEQRLYAEKEISNRVNELKSILRGVAVSITKYLIAANSGGVVAVLAYIHAMNTNSISGYIKFSLASFIIGIMAISVALIWLYRRAWKIEHSYVKDRELFLQNQISWPELERRDNEHCESDRIEHTLALFSFVLFFIGVVSGALNFL